MTAADENCKHCNDCETSGKTFLSRCPVCLPKDTKLTIKDQLVVAQAEIKRLRRLLPLSQWRKGHCNTCGADYGQSCDPEKSCGRRQIKEQRELIADEREKLL